jgi:exosortase H (IPTLxxWG-CTERM-specific)
MLRFVLTFTVLVVGLFLAELTPWGQKYVAVPWTQTVAKVSAGLVANFDKTAAAQGKVLYNQATGAGVSIEAGCNGLEVMIILLAAVLAFPATWKQRLAGLAIGFVAIQGLNLLRIISLFYLIQWDRAIFQFAHEYLWQALIMLDVLVVWLLWIRYVTPSAPSEPAPPLSCS